MQQAAFRPLHVDAVGAAVAATGHQLVAHVVDLVRIGALVAARAVGHQTDAGILVADVAVGDVGVLLLVVLQVVRAEELVAPAERHVALVLQIGLRPAQAVAFDGGRLLGTLLARGLGIAGRRRLRRLAECRNRVLDGTQRPAFGLLIVGQRGQAQGDAEG